MGQAHSLTVDQLQAKWRDSFCSEEELSRARTGSGGGFRRPRVAHTVKSTLGRRANEEQFVKFLLSVVGANSILVGASTTTSRHNAAGVNKSEDATGERRGAVENTRCTTIQRHVESTDTISPVLTPDFIIKARTEVFGPQGPNFWEFLAAMEARLQLHEAGYPAPPVVPKIVERDQDVPRD